ncbi:hypothetical protein [Paraglaciecola aestuariivivens]
MDINALILKYGDKKFVIDDTDELGSVMHLDEYKILIRHDDVGLANGMLIKDVYPLINSLKKR